NSYTYNGFQTPVFNMMTSLKYVVDNTTTTPKQSEEFYSEAASYGKFTAYENLYYLPIGYRVGSEILGWDYSNSNPFTVQNDYFERATGIPEVFTQLPIDYFDYNNISDFTSGYDDGELTFFRDTYDVDASFTANYNLTETAEYYIYINSSNVESVTMYYGDTEYEHNFGSEHIVSLGKIEAGSELSVNVPIDNGNSGYIDIYLCRLDEDKFTKGYETLKTEQLEVETFEETFIKGTVTANSDGVFYTSIPYDESWQIYVDGERVSTEEMQECKIGEGFIGFYISEGEHDVEFKYEARGLKLGICVSAVTILALLVIFVVLRKKKPVAALLGGYSENGELLEYTVDFEGNISEKKPEELTEEATEATTEETAEETTENPTEE
ncbi:MAG: YfhO family protein, partial [Clostridia bacterium]|nr:YfhO family protein [Clostridia bacterium]